MRRITRRPLLIALVTLVTTAPVCVTGCAQAATRTVAKVKHTDATADGYFVQAPVFDTPVYVIETGDPADPPILLVHGLGQRAARDWATVIDAFDERYHVLALDLPGFGRSPAPKTGRLSPASYARLLDWLIEYESLDDVRLVGHSMGAAIALYYASTHPQRIHNVTLVDVAGILHKVAFVKAMIAPAPDLSSLPDALERPMRRITGAIRGLLVKIGTAPDLSDLAEDNGIWHDLLGDRISFRAALALIQTDFSLALARFSSPVTILWGREDVTVPRRTAYLLDGRLRSSRLYWLPEAGHVPMIDTPAAFNAALAEALEFTAPAAATTSEPESEPRPTGANSRIVQGGIDMTLSGRFDRIVLRDCLNVSLVGVSARHIEILDSTVALRDVRVDADPGETGLKIRSSHVTATDLTITGAPAASIGGSHFDAAGATFRSDAAAVVIEASSALVLSVSTMRSEVYNGYLHGAADAAHTNLGALPAIRSTFTDGVSASERR